MLIKSIDLIDKFIFKILHIQALIDLFVVSWFNLLILSGLI